MPVTEYLRARAFSGRTRDRADVDAINLLSQIANGIKALYHLPHGPKHEALLQEALNETVAAIQRVWDSGANRRS
uniref:Hypothethical protein n=2 Tax=Ralstonia solanacearum TaxID=305 RepID=D8MYE0_RALSL|nr:hypothethical protein [Ralstonia solanacearum PSI07]